MAMDIMYVTNMSTGVNLKTIKDKDMENKLISIDRVM